MDSELRHESAVFAPSVSGGHSKRGSRSGKAGRRGKLGGVCVLLLLLLAVLPAHADARSRERFDAGWRFHLGDYAATSPAIPIDSWFWKAASPGTTAAQPELPPDIGAGDWQPMTIGQDIFARKPGLAWCRAIVTAPLDKTPVLSFNGVDDNAAVFVNGKRLFYHEGWNNEFEVDASSALIPGGPNTIVVLVINGGGGGGITSPVTADIPDVANEVFTGPGYDDAAWRPVHLPHDFVVEGKFDPHESMDHGYLPRGVGWYRKSFDLPATDKGRTIWLEFDGVGRDSQVWVNGHLLGRHPSGFTNFHYDFTQYAIIGGRNVVAVRADARYYQGWFYEGGGIYRHVWLTKMARVHAAYNGVFVTSTVTGDPASPSGATVTVKADIANDGDLKTGCHVISAVIDPAGKVVGSTSTDLELPVGITNGMTQTITVKRPRLWSLEMPNLYGLRLTITQTVDVRHPLPNSVDETYIPFGIRTARFDPNLGFFLNGKHVEIKGTCNHQDAAGVGVAIPDSLLAWRLKQLKSMGANAYRTAHNPPAAELLDDCDRLGILVMDENREFGDKYTPKAPENATANDLFPLRDMIQRDRNHPSIILWSLCNEEFAVQGNATGAKVAAAMKGVVNDLDGTRPVTAAMTGPHGVGISTVVDVEGFNYAIDNYDPFHAKFPDKPIVCSETSSEIGDRGIYATDPALAYMSAYDKNPVPWGRTAEFSWEQVIARPYIAGEFIWTGFDYKGESTPYAWPNINCRFGALDMCGFPKDNYYFYQSVWTDKPMAHILPHWTWPGKEGQPIDVWVYSNADHVELFLNGASLGAKPMPLTPHAAYVAGRPADSAYGHAAWSVPYAPGTLVAKGYDASGKLIAIDTVKTAGAPAALRITADRSTLSTDDEDTIVAQVAVVDADGNVIPTASNRVTFTVTGPAGAAPPAHIAGVGNGNPDDHDPDRGTERNAFNGLCMALLQSSGVAGKATVIASSPGLASATLKIAVKP